MITEAQCKIDIVHHENYYPVATTPVGDQIPKHNDLIMHIKVITGFIQQENKWLLRDQSSQIRSATLAPRKRCHTPITHLIKVDQFKCLPGLLNVLGRLSLKGIQPRMAPCQHRIKHRCRKEGLIFLKQYAQSLRPRTATETHDFLVIHNDLTTDWSSQTSQGLK